MTAVRLGELARRLAAAGYPVSVTPDDDPTLAELVELADGHADRDVDDPGEVDDLPVDTAARLARALVDAGHTVVVTADGLVLVDAVTILDRGGTQDTPRPVPSPPRAPRGGPNAPEPTPSDPTTRQARP